MPIRLLAWLLALLPCLPLAAEEDDDPPSADKLGVAFERLVFEHQGKKLPYRLLRPTPFDPAVKYPLVLWLHGAGERGTSNDHINYMGVLFAADKVRAQHPCFVIAPQCDKAFRWVETDWGARKPHTQPAEPSVPMGLTLALMEQQLQALPVDRARIYVSGLSMGGYGSWDIMARRPDWFAAAAIMCGGADDSTAARIAHIPQWIFHGDSDNIVPVERSRSMVAALKAAGGTPRYTEVAGRNHFVWDDAMNNPEFFTWLFSQRKAEAKAPGAPGPNPAPAPRR